jgi:outer membrane phospholipase A
MANLGTVHNRMSALRIASWNVYLQGGWEWNNSVHHGARLVAVPENSLKDDNPDIADYIRAGRLVAFGSLDKSRAVAVLLRNNLRWTQNAASCRSIGRRRSH